MLNLLKSSERFKKILHKLLPTIVPFSTFRVSIASIVFVFAFTEHFLAAITLARFTLSHKT